MRRHSVNRCTSIKLRGWVALFFVVLACNAGDDSTLDPLRPKKVTLKSLAPTSIIPDSKVFVVGENLVSQTSHTLELKGTVNATDAAPRDVTATVDLSVGESTAFFTANDEFFSALGPGLFSGSATVVSRNDHGETRGDALEIALTLSGTLTPNLVDIGDGVVYLNASVQLQAEGFLLNSQEGQTVAQLVGCFLDEGTAEPCNVNGRSIQTNVVVSARSETDREWGEFLFGPEIVGIGAGRFTGSVTLFNQHRGGASTQSESRNVQFTLLPSEWVAFDEPTFSLGQYLHASGRGFIGGAQASTILRFSGTFSASTGETREVNFDFVPEFVSGTMLRYVVEEKSSLGSVIDLRRETGTLQGTLSFVLVWQGTQVERSGGPVSLVVAPLKQVCWISFTENWISSLRRFGLQAADLVIRKRVFAVLARDYRGINVEFRAEKPVDFALYARVEIAGVDPNGLGLLGYDQTPGKDVGNQRLTDSIGGFNAQTQEDGFPGFGGVFAEALLGFSEHPPADIDQSPLHTPRFDQIFDPFRPEHGEEMMSQEAIKAPSITDTSTCPATTRTEQASCAIFVLGNLVGHTTSHEFGHSLGLADPYGSPTVFHNFGDLPNRLMEGGADRPFDERAELNGQGPAVFCKEEFLYLRDILPTTIPDPVAERPSCN